MTTQFPPTIQQLNFLSALLNTSSNLALRARAGCGKTTTILLGVNAYAKAKPNAEIIVCAYIKAKLIEAGHNDWRKVSATTIHSLGFGLIRFVFKSKIDDNKVRDLIENKAMANDASIDAQLYTQYGAQITMLVR